MFHIVKNTNIHQTQFGKTGLNVKISQHNALELAQKALKKLTNAYMYQARKYKTILVMEKPNKHNKELVIHHVDATGQTLVAETYYIQKQKEVL